MNGTAGRLETQVLIVGGGVMGTGLARDLALRGVKCLLVEKRHIDAGASGANHGLLHSGARYVSNDQGTAQECRSESHLLRELAPGCCEETGGLFVAVAGDNETYVADFPHLCEQSGIAVHAVPCREARELEPALAENVIAVYWVDDATVDPFRLSLDNMADAVNHGAQFLTHTQVIGLVRRGKRIGAVRLRRLRTGEELEVEAEQILNASGAWVGKVVELMGINLPVVWSKGSLLITHQRLADRVVNRLRPPADADIIVPGGTVSLAGTTSVRVNDIEHLRCDVSEVDFLVEETAKMVPAMLDTRLVRAFAGVRPLLTGGTAANDRALSRGFEIIDHERDGCSNLLTVVAGKLTTYRLVAEKTADLVCQRLGVHVPCLTRELALPAARVHDWVVAGLPPVLWRRHGVPQDALLCECEMVPMSALDQLVDRFKVEGEAVTLEAVSRRSRLGKGSCQGAFCSLRAAGFLYDRDIFQEDRGLVELKAFLEMRWKGLRPVLWGSQMVQEQLQEAIHCGLFNLEQVE